MTNKQKWGIARGYVYSNDDYLIHGKHKYIWKEKKPNGKWRYYYEKTKNLITGKNNIYDNISPKTYEEKKQLIMQTPEWKRIVATRDPEYVRKDENGNDVYLIDDYMMNKKHPFLDGLVDYGMGRKITTTKQSPETVVAGIKDYIKLGARTVENIMTAGVGLLTINLKNQQGSYEKQKKELRQKVKAGMQAVSNLLDKYSKAKSTVDKTAMSTYAESKAEDLINKYLSK